MRKREIREDDNDALVTGKSDRSIKSALYRVSR